MSHFIPTDEQRTVIETDHPRVIVAASAGSGKTTTLGYRYARLARDVQPHRILVVAFNVGAAAEIKRRIVRILRDAGRDEDAMDAETAPIQTLASFAGALVRENAFALGVDPSFETLTSADSVLLNQSVIRAAIAESHRLPTECGEYLRLTSGRSKTNLVDEAERRISDILSLLRRTPPLPGFSSVRGFYQHAYATVGDLHEDWAHRLREALPLAAQVDIPELPYPMLVAAAREWFRHHPPIPPWTNSQPGPEADDATATVGAVLLAADAWRRLDSRMAATQQFDFTAIENAALRLLTSPEPTFRAAKESVRARYDHLIVDEAQDIDPLQDRLLQELNIAHEMRVGDAQQSIYSFRLADPDAFTERVGHPTWQSLSLSTNHRSSAPILDFVNAGFRQLWGAKYLDMLPAHPPEPVVAAFDFEDSTPPAPTLAPVEAWNGGSNVMETIARGVQELIANGQPPSSIAVLLGTNAQVSEVTNALRHRRVETQTIGGASLFFSRMEIRDVANALRAAADPEDDFAMLALLHGPAVRLSLDSVISLALEGSVHPRLPEFEPEAESDREALRAFFSWFPGLAQRANHLPAWEVLSHLISVSPLLPRLAEMPLGPRAVANVRKLQILAINQPQLSALAFASSLSDVQALKHEVTDAEQLQAEDRVNVLTIHKAKGLQFPVVIVPTLCFVVSERWPTVEHNLRMPAIVARPPLKKSGGAMSNFLKAQRDQRNLAENTRQLYVALTRAQSRLIIVKDQASVTSPLQRWFKPGGPASLLPVRDFTSP